VRTATAAAMLASLSLVAACAERTMDPSPAFHPSFTVGVAGLCPASPTFVVSDEVGLTAALGAAQPGDVIALSGLFPVTTDVNITTEGLRLTCADPGAGVFAQPGGFVSGFVSVLASRVTIDDVVLDASQAFDASGALLDAVDVVEAEHVQFLNNTVQCGALCLFGVLSPGAIIAHNQFEAAGFLTFSGVHLLTGMEGTRIEGNTIIATAPVAPSPFGAIRVRADSNVVVADNVVRGPWSNSMAVLALAHSRVEGNRLEGARRFGLRLDASDDNIVHNNRVFGAESGGIFASQACRNKLIGNDLNGNGGNIGVIFDATTGANVMVIPLGSTSDVIDDGGNLDCNGDGVGDPNIITGPGSVRRGAPSALPEDPPVVITRRGIQVN